MRAARRRAALSACAICLVVVLLLSGVSLPRRGEGNSLSWTSASPRAIRVAQPADGATDLAGWFRLPTVGPTPENRTAGQMTYDSEDGVVVLFGGCPGYALLGLCSNYLNDTWEFTGGQWSELSPTLSPPARSSAVFADDPASGYVVLFGGRDPSGNLNDTWRFLGGAWAQLQPAHRPPALAFASMAFDAIDGDLVLFGGLRAGALNASAETWKFQDGDWTNLTSAVRPPGWVAPYLAPDSNNGQLVLYGGITAEFFPTYDEATWLFYNGTWQNITPALYVGPASRLWALTGFDPVYGYPLMFGGGGGNFLGGDMWEFTPASTWNQLWGAGDPPGAFYETQAAWDPAVGYTVDFTRETLTSFYGLTEIAAVLNETWALLTLLSIGVGNANPNIRVDDSVVLAANVTGGLPPYHYRWDLGDGTNVTGSDFTHVYNRTGSYAVELNVTDSVGQFSLAVVEVVNVTPGPGGPPSISFGSALLIAAEAGAVAAAVVLVLVRRRRIRRSPPVLSPAPASEVDSVPGLEGADPPPTP
ncbi:MAG: PKD domain-containing protein [Thermoplasmata archaeon]|nr:PKD domain-containing protein [Thermoplasmata archaeon]